MHPARVTAARWRTDYLSKERDIVRRVVGGIVEGR
jgi:hypothetical protein